MADMQLRTLFERSQRTFAGAGNTRLKSDFIDAVNDSANEINLLANLESEITTVTSEDATLTNLDGKFAPQMWRGVMVHLIDAGHRPISEIDVGKLRQRWEDDIGMIQYDVTNTAQLADDDDDTTDTAQLGKLGA